MKGQRKQIGELIYSLKTLRDRLKYVAPELVRVEGQKAFNAVCTYYQKVIDKLTKERDSLPIGHRYSGNFYVRNPYSFTLEYTKVAGVLFMREDLISWTTEKIDQPELVQYYMKTAYKNPSNDHDNELRREDGVPIYEINNQM
jgi:hypothetical protein